MNKKDRLLTAFAIAVMLMPYLRNTAIEAHDLQNQII